MAENTSESIRTYRSYIAGKDVDGQGWVYVLSPRALLDDAFASLSLKRTLERGDQAFDVVDPEVVLGRVAVAGPESVQAALESAAAAAPLWTARPLADRVERFLGSVWQRLREHADDIVDALVAEGHPISLGKWEVSGMLEGFGPEARRFYAEQLCHEYEGPDRRKLLVRRQPDGVVCVNPPANAPMSSVVLAALSLAAGNALVVRAPRSAPLGVMFAVQELIAPALEEVGAPPGTLNVICGDPGPVLGAWIDSPLVDDIMYFGSTENGLEFERRCVAAGKKPILELAGNDAVIVWKDANLEYAAEALTESFYGSGQLCMVPNQVVAHPDIADELIQLLAEMAAALRPGYPDDESVLLTPVLRNEKYYRFLAQALESGATLITGGHGMQLDGTRDDAGMFLAPTVLRVDGLGAARRLDAVREETFFPLLPVVVPDSPVDDDLLLDVLIDYVNSNAYGLRNSVWATDPLVVDALVGRITNGGLLKVNDSHIGFIGRLPTHGGTGLTGGAFGEANYPALRTSHIQGVAISRQANRPRDAVFGAWNRTFGTEDAS
ncbi:aldehyde dehydrogenase [Nocardia sp. NPDC006630]|uniref:aldehyde dehydrogenase family protein n=1 Tax=Nocardia sp. NPDC006630 TaxID=3157181 RepID=UPI0033A0144E